jgi:hypothetical protein
MIHFPSQTVSFLAGNRRLIPSKGCKHHTLQQFLAEDCDPRMLDTWLTHVTKRYKKYGFNMMIMMIMMIMMDLNGFE